MWSDRKVPLKTKGKVYNTSVRSALSTSLVANAWPYEMHCNLHTTYNGDENVETGKWCDTIGQSTEKTCQRQHESHTHWRKNYDNHLLFYPEIQNSMSNGKNEF